MIPHLQAVANVISFDSPVFIDFFLFDGIFDVYYSLAQ